MYKGAFPRDGVGEVIVAIRSCMRHEGPHIVIVHVKACIEWAWKSHRD